MLVRARLNQRFRFDRSSMAIETARRDEGARGRFFRRAARQAAANFPIPSISPGTPPATKSSTMEVEETSPQRTSGVKGGIAAEMAGEAASIAAANLPGQPSFRRTGISASPSAEASAAAGPEAPPNIAEPRIETCPSPPLKPPTGGRAMFTRQPPDRTDIIRPPARMKNGIASIGKLRVGV